MRIVWKLLFANAVLSVCAQAFAFQPPAGYAAAAYDAALDAAKQSGKPVMLYFTQERCIFCKRVEALLAAEELRSAFAPNYHFVAVDLTRGQPRTAAEQDLIDRLRIGLAPTFVFLNRDGQHICTSYGGIGRAEEGLAVHRFVQARKDDAVGGKPAGSRCGLVGASA